MWKHLTRYCRIQDDGKAGGPDPGEAGCGNVALERLLASPVEQALLIALRVEHHG